MIDWNWDNLTDFHGNPGTELPQLIHSLAGATKTDQANLLSEIMERIAHQGSHSRLAVLSIPKLVEFLANDQNRIPDRTLGCLRTLAIGLDSDELHQLIPMEQQIDSMRFELENWTEDQKAERDWGPMVGLECYEAVKKAVPLFMKFLDHRSTAVRIEAQYNLSWFPSAATQSLPELRNRLEDTNIADAEFANLILSVGLLEFHCEAEPTGRQKMVPLLESRESMIRYAAAIYLDWHGRDDSVESVMNELAENEDAEFPEIPFNDHMGWDQYAETRVEDY